MSEHSNIYVYEECAECTSEPHFHRPSKIRDGLYEDRMRMQTEQPARKRPKPQVVERFVSVLTTCIVCGVIDEEPDEHLAKHRGELVGAEKH